MVAAAPIEIALALCDASLRARPVDDAAVKALAGSIAENGLLSPITVRPCKVSRGGRTIDGFEIVAGHHRVKAFGRLGRETIPAFVVEIDDLRAELALIDENLCRNDLTPAERAAATARRKAIYVSLHPETKHGGDRMSDQVAKLATCSERFTTATAEATGHSERNIQRDAHRGEALGDDALRVARTSLDKGDELDALAKMAPEARAALIDRAAAGEKVSAKVEAKKQSRDVREADLAARQWALPERRFGVILADPEWRFEPWSRETGLDRAADNHYPTSALEAIKARDVPSIAADDCVLFLWSPGNRVADAIDVMRGWGFAYVSLIVWGKPRAGTGYWVRDKCEILLIGRRGKPPGPAPGTQCESLIPAPLGEHSAKPEIFLEIVERYFPRLPKIELNRRGPPRPGWIAWGNEAEGGGDASPPLDANEGRGEGDAGGPTWWAEARRMRAATPAPRIIDIAVALGRSASSVCCALSAAARETNAARKRSGRQAIGARRKRGDSGLQATGEGAEPAGPSL